MGLPKLHNAMWPGLVGKGEDEGQEPPISLERMLELTANAEVNGQKFEGVDYFLFHPHTDPDATDDELEADRRLDCQQESKGRLVSRARMGWHGRRLGNGHRRATSEIPIRRRKRMPHCQGLQRTWCAPVRMHPYRFGRVWRREMERGPRHQYQTNCGHISKSGEDCC